MNKNKFKLVQYDLQEGKKTFQYFFSKFLNNFYENCLDLKFSIFKNYIEQFRFISQHFPFYISEF
jgi:hypothetical protein